MYSTLIKIRHIVVLVIFCSFSSTSFSQKYENSSLPPNPKPDKCYMRCFAEDGNLQEWKAVPCNLIRERGVALEIELTPETEFLSKKDKKKITRKIGKLIKKDYSVLVIVPFDSPANDSINKLQSDKKEQVLKDFFSEENYPENQIFIVSVGSYISQQKCYNDNPACKKILKENNTIRYRVAATSPLYKHSYKLNTKEKDIFICKLK